MGMMEAKEQDFRNVVEEISKDLGLETTPKVEFYDGYIPNKSSNVIACIDTTNHVIYVSRRHLMTMNANDIRRVVRHELSHYKVKPHGAEFDKEYVENSIGSFNPIRSGVVNINGGKRATEEENKVDKIGFEEFHDIAKKRLAVGWSAEATYRDAPKGYTEWAKQNFNEKGGIKLPSWKDSKINCKNCGTVIFRYYEKCPHCGFIRKRKRL
ncbi:MAG: hypothetical protein FK734_19890 [Asgard group archaeon]|nr:hypothetical protein [Asgard group archaeon]